MIRWNFEYPRKIRVGFVGCGDHAFRNIFPTFQFAPIDLIAVCDLREERARAFARLFGAQRYYTDMEKMLVQEELEAIFLVTGYGPDHRPTYPALARKALEAGCYVWMEKPPSTSSKEIEDLITVSQETGRFVMVGFKKCFTPALQKVKEWIQKPEFGRITSAYLRYPQSLPPQDKKGDPQALLGFLDHIVHPGSVIQYLFGPVRQLYYQRSLVNGAVTALLTIDSTGPVILHLTAGQSGTSPLERLEVIGEGANLLLENGCRLTYYRRGRRGEGGYGRAGSFIGPDEDAPLYWEPEFSLGTLYNKGLFLLGYAPEVLYFCECVLSHTPPTIAGLEDALAIMRLYEAFLQPENTLIPVQ